MKVCFSASPAVGPEDAVVAPVPAKDGDGLPEAERAALERMASRGRLDERLGRTALLSEVGDAGWLVASGCRTDAPNPRTVEAACAHAYAALKLSGARRIVLRLAGHDPDRAAQAAAEVLLAAYRFDRHLTRPKERAPTIEEIAVHTSDPQAAERAYAAAGAVAQGICFARDLVSEPPNVLDPVAFAERCCALRSVGLEVEVLDRAALERLGLRLLLGVAQGSASEGRLVILKWRGLDDDSSPVAFIGKGVTFDSGGLSLKAPDAMEEMKTDMAGAAAVAGLMQAMAVRKARINAVGVLGLVENMPDGAAQRPGDIVVAGSGCSVEIVNTDAEGRLVLADALWFCRERFGPRCMIDLATLTGTIGIALGPDYAGLFCNDDGLAAALAEASRSSGEALWRMPLPAAYDHMLDSPVADMKNRTGRSAGHITAALFLKRFVGEVPWAHLDIAPVAWRSDARLPASPQGASGFGVRLLDQWVRDHCEPRAQL